MLGYSPRGPTPAALHLHQLYHTQDPVKIAEDYAMLQHLADGRST